MRSSGQVLGYAAEDRKARRLAAIVLRKLDDLSAMAELVKNDSAIRTADRAANRQYIALQQR